MVFNNEQCRDQDVSRDFNDRYMWWVSTNDQWYIGEFIKKKNGTLEKENDNVAWIDCPMKGVQTS